MTTYPQPNASTVTSLIPGITALDVGLGHSVSLEAPESSHPRIIAKMKAVFPYARYTLNLPFVWLGN